MAHKTSRAKRQRRGVALVMVLGAIAVLTVFLTDLQQETSSELSAALAERDAVRAEYIARSGVNLARLLIASEPKVRANLLPILALAGMTKIPQIPVWSFSDTILGPFNDQAGGAALAGLAGLDVSTGKNLGLTGGRFELKIVDEQSKININAAAKGSIGFNQQLSLGGQLIGLMSPQEYNPLFEARDADNQFSDRAAICGALMDWADEDENLFGCDQATTASSSAQGIEDNFYQTIGLEYRRKNAPYDSLDELRLVRGMSDDFWATFVDPDPNDPAKRALTVWGKPEPKVNVNTAPPIILLALICDPAVTVEAPLCTNPEQAATFISVLTLAKSFIPGGFVFPTGNDFYAAISQSTRPPIGAAIGGFFKNMGIEKVIFKSRTEFLKKVDNKTDFLSIYSEGVIPGNKHETRIRIHAVVDISGATPVDQTGGQIPGQVGSTNTPLSGNSSGILDASGTAYEQQIKQSSAGAIVYWRIE